MTSLKPVSLSRIREFAFGSPWRALIAPYVITVSAAFVLSMILPLSVLGSGGGILMFVVLVWCSWYQGIGPAIVSPLLLVSLLRIRTHAVADLLNFTSKELIDLLVVTIVTTAVGVSGTMRRRTEEVARKQAAQLIEQDRRKDEFLATLAHELRNPLSPIRMGLELLEIMQGRPDEDPEAVREVHQVMRRQINHMVRLIDDLMDVSRINTGKIEIRKSQVPLADVIRDAVEAARPALDAAMHHLSLNLPDEAILVDVDQVRISQVFVNLLNNASKFTDSGGQIWMDTVLQGDVVEIHVRDNGIGMSASLIPHVFEMFVQSDDLLTRRHGGLGIGLSLARALTRLHGGEIEALSDGPGRGSEFVVTLPCFVRAPSTQATNGALSASSGARRILVVDDNRDAATTLATMLAAQGHQCDVAFDGMAALQTAVKTRPDIFFLDIGMPAMSGFELAARLRSCDEFKSSLMVAVTGWGRPQDRRKCLESGFDEHLVKPATAEQLQQVLCRQAAS